MSGHWIIAVVPPPVEAPRGAAISGEAAACLWFALRDAARFVSRALRRPAAVPSRLEPRDA